jgi:glycosyltransferase involved in cell wall biosynthesis
MTDRARLTILHISTRLILGGSQENTVLSCEGQAELGHDVHLAYGPIYGPEGSLFDRADAFRTGDGRRIHMHELPNLVREVHPVRDHLCFHRDLRNLMREVNPDVVHTHSSKAGILGRWAGWIARNETGDRPAVVHTIHGPPFMPLEGAAPARAKTALVNQVYTHAERFAAKRCDSIVSVADAMTEQFVGRGIGRPEQYVTVRSGMETAPFLEPAPGEDRRSIRAELGFTDDDFVVGTVARLAQHKGHDDLLDALAEPMRTHEDIRLLWVGDGWWRERLLARVADLGLADRVSTTGLVPQSRVPAMMRAMDVLAHPSSREGLPRTVPQALLAGVCPVAYDVDGTREACIDGETGRLVPHGDTAALRDAILWLRENPHDRLALAAEGRDRCSIEFQPHRDGRSPRAGLRLRPRAGGAGPLNATPNAPGPDPSLASRPRAHYAEDMSQNPYGGEQFGDFAGDEPQRTSALAIGSLVCSLICCLPVVPLLGAGLGVGALIGIGGSNGRVGGKGLAVAGIIIGVLMSIAQATVGVMGVQGLNFFSQMVFGSANQFMTQVEAGDYDAARGSFAGNVAAFTDEQFEAFRDGYQGVYGSFVEIPTDWFEIFPAYAAVQTQMQAYQGSQNLIPMPATFDNGAVLMVAVVDPNASQPGGQSAAVIPVSDIWIVLPDGTELRLSGVGGAQPAPAVPAPAQDAPAPETPDDDGP